MLSHYATMLGSRLARQAQPALVRAFAAAAEAVATKDPECPVKLNDGPGMYATSLWSVATQQSLLTEVETDVAQVRDTMLDNPDIIAFLEDPSAKPDAKRTFVSEMLEDFEAEDITKNFMNVLADNQRIAELPEILDSFDSIMAAARGEVTATVTVASIADFTDAQAAECRTALQAMLEPGQTLVMEVEENPELLGGMVFEIGEKYIDCSVATRVAEMERIILSDDGSMPEAEATA